MFQASFGLHGDKDGIRCPHTLYKVVIAKLYDVLVSFIDRRRAIIALNGPRHAGLLRPPETGNRWEHSTLLPLHVLSCLDKLQSASLRRSSKDSATLRFHRSPHIQISPHNHRILWQQEAYVQYKQSVLSLSSSALRLQEVDRPRKALEHQRHSASRALSVCGFSGPRWGEPLWVDAASVRAAALHNCYWLLPSRTIQFFHLVITLSQVFDADTAPLLLYQFANRHGSVYSGYLLATSTQPDDQSITKMGASSSKAAARGAARKYPTRTPGAVPQATTRARPQQPAARGDGSKDEGQY